MHYLYILHSDSIDKYYIGESPNPKLRLKQHNEHYFKKGYTKAAKDWKIALSKKCDSKDDAVYLEKFIKRMKSRKFIEKIIESPEILDDVLSKK